MGDMVIAQEKIPALGQTKIESGASFSERRIMLGVLLMSFASLLLELALTRLFSVILFYHFAFLAISIALLGLGAGGVFSYVTKRWLERWTVGQIGTFCCSLNAALMLLVVEVDLHVPVALFLSWANFRRLTEIYLVSALPFFFTGLFFSVLFARRHSQISQLYAADLLGGAMACIGIVPMLNVLGGPNAILFGAVAMAAGALLWAERPLAKRIGGSLLVVFVVLIAANYRGKLIDIVYAKGARRDKPWVEFAKWNAISRIEVDNLGWSKSVVIDADASTYIMGRDPKDRLEGNYEHQLMSAPSSVANILRPHGDYAIIGPGGGVDVLRAVAVGSPSVTGIEINPIIATTIMRERYAEYSYQLYLQPNVHIQVSDGRSWVRQSKQKFDVLQMTLVDTWASTAAGAFALSENNLYTVEAFREYFDHLKPNGYIAITRWEFARPREAVRVVGQAIRAMNGGDLRRNFIVICDGDLNQDGRPVTVLAKRSAFTTEEEASVKAHLAKHENLHALYLPSDGELPSDSGAALYQPNQEIFRHVIQSGNPEMFAENYPFNVAPVYDESPFFFFTLKPSQVLGAGTQTGIDWKVNMGLVVLLMLVIISALAVGIFLLLPLLLTSRARTSGGWLPLLYFVAIGLGYIAVEITLIQRLVLFLGHPIYAMTVVVFLMLLSSGVGSSVSRKWFPNPAGVVAAFGFVIALLAAYYFALSPILHALVGLSQATKIAIAAVLIIPLGFAMGMPFPSGLRMLGEGRGDDNRIEWAWAMNAASSVLGSVLSMAIAIQFGLGVTLICGVAAYVLGMALTRSRQWSAA